MGRADVKDNEVTPGLRMTTRCMTGRTSASCYRPRSFPDGRPPAPRASDANAAVGNGLDLLLDINKEGSSKEDDLRCIESFDFGLDDIEAAMLATPRKSRGVDTQVASSTPPKTQNKITDTFRVQRVATIQKAIDFTKGAERRGRAKRKERPPMAVPATPVLATPVLATPVLDLYCDEDPAFLHRNVKRMRLAGAVSPPATPSRLALSRPYRSDGLSPFRLSIEQATAMGPMFLCSA